MPNAFAYLVLFCWPLVCAVVFASKSPLSATCFTIIGGFILLPVGISVDLPMIPALDKNSIAAITALVMLAGRGMCSWVALPPAGAGRFLVQLALACVLATVMTNPEPVLTDQRALPGLTLYDTVSMLMGRYLGFVPFIVGCVIVRSIDDLLSVTRLLVASGLLLSLPALFEVRMSPQLHTWVYGFFPHSFLQQFRFDGFRPVVFSGHSLVLAMYFAVCLVAAALLYCLRERVLGLSPPLILGYMSLVLIAAKGVGAIVLGGAGMLLVVLFYRSPTLVARAASMLALSAITYPVLCMLGWFPHDLLLDFAVGISPERAESLAFRFHHEELLLNKAIEKPLFGWGGWGRNRLDESVTDGYWVITLGVNGFVGFLASFGLVAAIALKGGRLVRTVNTQQEALLVAVWALIMGLILVNQLPNADLGNVYWFMAGCLAGASQGFLSGSAPEEKSNGFDSRRAV